MRLGAYTALLKDGSARGPDLRHHRRSKNATATAMRSTSSTATSWKQCGLIFSGMSPRRQTARDRRGQGPPLVHRRPVPPGAEVQTLRAASAVRGFRAGGGGGLPPRVGWGSTPLLQHRCHKLPHGLSSPHAHGFPPRWLPLLLLLERGKPREPAHIHVMGAGGEAKFWLRPEVAAAESQGLDARALRRLCGVVEERRELIERAWHDYFG